MVISHDDNLRSETAVEKTESNRCGDCGRWEKCHDDKHGLDHITRDTPACLTYIHKDEFEDEDEEFGDEDEFVGPDGMVLDATGAPIARPGSYCRYAGFAKQEQEPAKTGQGVGWLTFGELPKDVVPDRHRTEHNDPTSRTKWEFTQDPEEILEVTQTHEVIWADSIDDLQAQVELLYKNLLPAPEPEIHRYKILASGPGTLMFHIPYYPVCENANTVYNPEWKGDGPGEEWVPVERILAAAIKYGGVNPHWADNRFAKYTNDIYSGNAIFKCKQFRWQNASIVHDPDGIAQELKNKRRQRRVAGGAFSRQGLNEVIDLLHEQLRTGLSKVIGSDVEMELLRGSKPEAKMAIIMARHAALVKLNIPIPRRFDVHVAHVLAATGLDSKSKSKHTRYIKWIKQLAQKGGRSKEKCRKAQS